MGTRTPSYHSFTSSVPDQEALTDELSDIASSVESLIIKHDDAYTSDSDSLFGAAPRDVFAAGNNHSFASSVSVQDELTLPYFDSNRRNLTVETNTYYLDRADSIDAKLAKITTFSQSSEVHQTTKWNSLTEEQVSPYRGRNADTFSTQLCGNIFTIPSETHDDECCIC